MKRPGTHSNGSLNARIYLLNIEHSESNGWRTAPTKCGQIFKSTTKSYYKVKDQERKELVRALERLGIL